MSSLPFSIPIYAGVAKAEGLIRLDGHTVVLEFEIRDRALGVLRSELREVRLPLSDLKSLRVEKPWFRKPRILGQAESLRASRLIPGSIHGQFTLHVAAENELAARSFASQVEVERRRQATSRLRSR